MQNYSARVWGGLVRDYYREWLRREFDAMKNGTPFDANQFMVDYYGKTVGTTPFTPCADPVADAKAWLKQAMAEPLPKVAAPTPVVPGEQVGGWTPANTPAECKTVEWPFPADCLGKLNGVVFSYTGGNHRLEIKSVEIVADGKTVAAASHFGFAGIPSRLNTYKLAIPAGTVGNNSCLIRAVVRGGGGTDSKGTVHLIAGKP